GSGVTTFDVPTVLQAGVADYFVDFGSGRNRWGDYSATVLDPTDPNTFWTFQQLVVAPDTWGVQVTEINFDPTLPVPGLTANDGIFVTVRDTAALVNNSSVSGNDVTSNGNHGVHISLEDTAMITSLDMVGNSSSDNGAQGILFDTSGTPTLGSLNITGPGDVTGNGDTGIDVRLTDVLGTPDVNIDGMNASGNAVRGISLVTRDTPLGNVSLSGNTASSNMNGAGIFLDINNTAGMDVASITVDRNTAEDNTAATALDGTGIDVLLDFVNLTGSFSISDSALVANNSGRGISVVGTNVDATGVTFNVNGNIVNNSMGGDGILLDLTDSTIGPLMLVANTSNSNFGDGIRTQLTNVTGTPDVTISSNFVDNNGDRGVVLSANSSPLGALLFNANSITNSQGNSVDGDGLLIQLVNSGATSLEVSESGMNGNAGDGLDLDLTGSPIGQVDIVDNSLGGMGSQIGLTFLIDGDTFGQPFSIINSSDPGINITDFFLDIAPTGVVWDTEEPGAAIPFLPLLASDVTTGLTTINGTTVVPPIVPGPGFDDTQDSIGTVLPGGGVPDDGTIIDLAFTDFNPAETFTWESDVDFFGVPGSGVDGSHLIGSDIRVDFTGGLFLTGQLQAVAGNSEASTFVATGGTPTISGGLSANGNNGIRISAAAGSDIGGLNIDNNLVDGNGENGIEFLISDSTLPDGTTNRIQVTNNSITDNGNDGVRMVAPDTNGTGIAIDFDSNTITGNVAGAGLNLSFNDNAGDIDTTVTSNDISNNGADGISLAARQSINVDASFDGNTIGDNGELGVHVLARENVVLDLDFGQDGTIAAQNVINSNVDAGIGIQLFNNVAATLDVANTMASNTTNGGNTAFDGDGLRVITNDTSTIAGVTIGDAVATNTAFTGNAARGISFEVGQGSSVMPVTIRNIDASSNGDDGIQFVRFADSVLDDITITDSTINSNGDDGVAFDLQGGGLFLIDATLERNELNGNNGNGINLNLDADVRLLADISDNDIFDSGLSGIRGRTRFDSQLDGTWSDNFIRNSGTAAASDGILVQATERSMVGQNGGLFIQDSEISGSSRDGVRIDAGNSALQPLRPRVTVSIRDNEPQTITDTRGITGNAGSGVNLIASSSAVMIARVDTSFINMNGEDGIQATTSGAAHMFTDARDNLISENGRHGVNLNTSGTSGMTVGLDDNQILRNTRRGVSLVNTGNADTDLTINGAVDPRASSGAVATSRIEQNGEVGVYIENNAGAIDTNNNIDLTLMNTAIVGNGTNTGVSADDRNGVWIRVGTSSFGAVNATVDQNFMSGNGNVDFVTQSFTATPDPNVASQYTNGANFTADPVARLGLLMTDNTGDTADVTRFGATYNNADQFKSPAAIFNSTSRLRNAQRFATDMVARMDSVQAAPAPTTTVFAGNGGGIGPNNTLLGLGLTISGNNRDITAFNNGNNAITINPALGAAPGVGTNFTINANDISGTGDSTFRSNVTSLASNNP
ncbi:MAG: beta strand repeat-containing protein, partial [Maioricimonas sp. JB049]